MDTNKTVLRRLEWMIAILVTAAAVALHFFYWFHVGGLWRDEVNLVNLSSGHSLAEMEKDSFPLLMPVTFHGWMAMGLGHSDLNLRLFGLLTGLGFLAALWISNWKIHRAPPLAGMVLAGLNGTLIFFGDSLRAYGLGSVLAVALTGAAFAFLRRPSTKGAVWLTLFAVLSVQTLYHNAVVVAAVCFGAWAVCWRRKDGRAAVQVLFAAVLAAASLLPYVHNFVSNGDAALRTGLELSRLAAACQETLGYPWRGYIYIWALLGAAIIFRAGAGFRKRSQTPAGADEPLDETDENRKESMKRSPSPLPSPPGEGESHDDLSLFAATALTFAAIGFLLFFWRSQMPMQSWYLLPFMALAAVCFDVVLAVLGGVWRAAVLIFVVITACISIPETGKILESHFSDVDVYARQLTAVAGPKDYIIVEPWHIGITFGHYFKGAASWDTLPPLSDHSTHRFDLVQLEIQNTNAIEPSLRQIMQTLQSGHRVWVLALDGWMGVPGRGSKPPPSLPAAPLPDTVWADWPYTRVWAAQVACYLADHSRQFQQLKSPASGRFITENMDWYMAEGWETNSPSP